MNVRTLNLKNEQDRLINFIVEPWYAEHAVPAGAHIELQVSFAEDGVHEIEVSENAMTIWLWPTSTFRIFIDGVDVTGPGKPAAFPSLPSDMTTRQFMDMTGLSEIKGPKA